MEAEAKINSSNVEASHFPTFWVRKTLARQMQMLCEEMITLLLPLPAIVVHTRLLCGRERFVAGNKNERPKRWAMKIICQSNFDLFSAAGNSRNPQTQQQLQVTVKHTPAHTHTAEQNTLTHTPAHPMKNNKNAARVNLSSKHRKAFAFCAQLAHNGRKGVYWEIQAYWIEGAGAMWHKPQR